MAAQNEIDAGALERTERFFAVHAQSTESESQDAGRSHERMMRENDFQRVFGECADDPFGLPHLSRREPAGIDGDGPRRVHAETAELAVDVHRVELPADVVLVASERCEEPMCECNRNVVVSGNDHERFRKALQIRFRAPELSQERSTCEVARDDGQVGVQPRQILQEYFARSGELFADVKVGEMGDDAHT